MTERQLKKLRRAELLEILLTQSREMDELKKRMAEAEEKLKARETVMAEAESLAAATAELKQLIATVQGMVDQLDRSRPEKEGASGQLYGKSDLNQEILPGQQPEKNDSDQEEHQVQEAGGSVLDAEKYPGQQPEKIDSDQEGHPIQDSGGSAPDAECLPEWQSEKSDPDTEAFRISQEMKNCARKRKRALKKCRKNQSQNRKSS